MRTDRGGAPAPMSFYHGDHQGFSIGPAPTPPPSANGVGDEPRPSRRGRDAARMAGLFVVCAASAYAVAYLPGAGRSIGLGASGRLAETPPARPAQTPPPRPLVEAPLAAPDATAATAAAPPTERFDLPPPPDLPPVRQTPVRQIPAKPVRHPARVAVASPARPAFHCDWRLRPSERMVCGDAELSRLDRRLNHAFQHAVRAGAAKRPLRAQQDRWELVRERAARQGKAAVARLYRQRIATLESFAR